LLVLFPSQLLPMLLWIGWNCCRAGSNKDAGDEVSDDGVTAVEVIEGIQVKGDVDDSGELNLEMMELGPRNAVLAEANEAAAFATVSLWSVAVVVVALVVGVVVEVSSGTALLIGRHRLLS
jgi:hypothetical protein